MTPREFIVSYLVLAVVSLVIVLRRLTKDEPYDATPIYLFGGLIGLGILIIPLALTLAIFTKQNCVDATVLSVGGCDRNGTCGVATDVGPAIAHYPVLGQTVHISCEPVWK